MAVNNFDIPQAVSDRFWAKVSKQENGCWLWMGKKGSNGRYVLFYLNGKFIAVHKWLYKLIWGEVPQGHFIHHRCRNGFCVNPDHLYLATDPRGRTDEERFWEKVDKSGDCWNWTAKVGKRATHNYGKFFIDGRWMQAHRYAYQLAQGEIPEGMVVRHRCDNPLCVRFEHLEIGTQADNVADMDNRGRRNPAKGNRVNTAKLTEDKVREIRALYRPRQGAALARQYGVSGQVIKAIVDRQIWKHVE